MADLRPTLIYCRESRDENCANFERIETQRDMLLAFCENRGLVNIVDVILDDDVTGTNFKRLEGIVERVKRKELAVIVFKDSSRLGRNLRESLNFIHILETYGVEILFESENYNEDIFPLFAWFNEQRAKEDSKKIRNVFKYKMQTGDLLIRPVYGYKKGPNNEMMLDEETSKVVRYIYQRFLAGKGTLEIAAELNCRGVPTPSQHANIKSACENWNRQHIWRIIKNDVYTGRMTYGKRTSMSYKNKKVVDVNPEDWIVIEHHHAAIISEEMFEQVQAVRRTLERKHCRKKNRPFSGMLRCGRCESNMVLRLRANRKDAYLCGKNHREGAIKDHIRPNYGCGTHHVTEDYLYHVVEQYMRNLLQEESPSLERMKGQLSKQTGHEPQLALWQKKLQETEEIIEKIYEDRLSGLIDSLLFQRKFEEYRRMQTRLQSQISEALIRPAPERRREELDLDDILDTISRRSITHAQLTRLFETIIVFSPREINEEKKRRYGLSEELFEELWANGGILFIEKTTTAQEGMKSPLTPLSC